MDELAQFLAAVRSRLSRRRVAGDGLLVLTLGGALGLGLLLLGGSGARLAFLGLAAATALGLAVVAVHAVLRRQRDEELALLVGRWLGRGDLLLSALELGRRLPELQRHPVMSPSLVVALVAQARAAVAGADLRRLVPMAPLRPRLGALGLVVAAVGLALLVAPARLAASWTALLEPPRPAPRAAPDPIVGDLVVRLDYPAYTRRPPRTIQGSSGEILAPRGTLVLVTGRPLVPVARAEVETRGQPGDGGAAVSVLPVELRGGLLQATFSVGGAGGYRFVMRTPRGAALREAEEHRVEVEPDLPPRVELRAPQDDLEVGSARARVELEYGVEDDYGIGDLELVWAPVAGEDRGERRIHVRAPAKGEAERTASGRWTWDLRDVDLGAAPRIAYRLEARDNNSVGGPGVGASRTLHLHLASPQQRHDETIQAAQRLLEKAISLLGDGLEEGRREAGGDARQEIERRLALLSRLDDLVAEGGRLQAEQEKDRLAPRDLRPALGEMLERLTRIARATEAQLRDARSRIGPTGLPAATLRGVREAGGKLVAELERDVLALDDLVGRQQIAQLLRVADEMARARDRLRGLLSQYRAARSEELRREIERELRALERQIAELQGRASRLLGELPDEHLNREALADGDLRARLEGIRDLLARGDVDRAAAELQRLSQSIDRLVTSLEGDLRGFRGERFSVEERALGELDARLADLEQEERRLQRETGELAGRLRQQAERVVRERVEPLLRQALERAAELRRRVGAIDAEAIGPLEMEAFERARRNAEDVGRALATGDLDQARDQARATERGLAALDLALQAQEQRQWLGMQQAIREARGKMGEARKLAARLAEDLGQAFPRADELLAPAERARLGELRERQLAVARRTDEARRSVERRSPAMQIVDQALRDAGQHMERAGQQLAVGEPRGALGEEQEAADRLGQLRREVQQLRRPREETGVAGSDELVRIPGADEHRAPRSFREELLEAMRRAAPEQYREPVRRFYEELAR